MRHYMCRLRNMTPALREWLTDKIRMHLDEFDTSRHSENKTDAHTKNEWRAGKKSNFQGESVGHSVDNVMALSQNGSALLSG